MNTKENIIQRMVLGPSGTIATASLLICAVSGVFLAVPYKPAAPFNSISLMLIDNPFASYIRNIHFWSAQFFLVFIILHFIDHFIRRTEYNVSRGIWFRLTLSLPVILFVMISGFILKGDADGLSAYRILSSLVERIYLAGNLLKDTLLGSENDLGLVYVHHIATATIILFIVLYEHSRKIWPEPVRFLITLFTVLLFSYLLQAPFGEDSGKGPWYFTGLQEILHWSPRPGWTWLILLFIMVVVWLLPRMNILANRYLKYLLLVFIALYIILSVIGTFFRGENWKWQWPGKEYGFVGNLVAYHPLNLKVAEDYGYYKAIPLVNGHPEGCLVCHSNVIGFKDAHDPVALGCYSCHDGDRFSLDKTLAHKQLIRIPGNLSDAEKSCGSADCHPDIPHRVNNSIMSTMSGVVTVDRFVFGETHSLSGQADIRRIGHTAADEHLRDLCANCHIGHMKTELGPITQLSRGGGCNACHLSYSSSAEASLKTYMASKTIQAADTFYHPQLNLDISDGHCFGCHSRSGRISTSYEGWHETMLDTGEIPKEGKYSIQEDRRVFEYINDDVHHAKGMVCIDCHVSVEAMGDGHLYAHKEQQSKVRCEDCHFSNMPATLSYQELDAESKKIVTQRKWKVEDKRFIVGNKSGVALINAWLEIGDKAVLRLKSVDTLLNLLPPAPVCTRDKSHSALGCESCHTPWAPQCIGCHNTYDDAMKGYDLLDDRDKIGTWIEHVGRFFAEPPALGIVTDSNGARQVKTFIPGMIINIDTSYFTDDKTRSAEIFRRLYAPVSAHTTSLKGRSCSSCHCDPLAIGYGRGELVYKIQGRKGKWVFNNHFALNEYDRLPEDAWIGFLEERKDISATRSNARPFNLGEQKAILTVGACLKCHKDDSKVMQESLLDFPSLLKKVSNKCILPVWE